MPRKVRQLIADLTAAGWRLTAGGKGSHRKFKHPRVRGSIMLSGQAGADARPYQEDQITAAVAEAKLTVPNPSTPPPPKDRLQ